MNITEFNFTGKYNFEGTVVKWKGIFKLAGTFKTSFQDYPEDKTTPLYASTVVFTLTDPQGKIYDLTEHENQELEEILNDKIDEFLEANSKKYS